MRSTPWTALCWIVSPAAPRTTCRAAAEAPDGIAWTVAQQTTLQTTSPAIQQTPVEMTEKTPRRIVVEMTCQTEDRGLPQTTSETTYRTKDETTSGTVPQIVR